MRIKKIERLIVKYHEQIVGTLSLTPDNKQCAFEYDKAWLSNGFSISPLELPLKPGLFIAKPSPFYGNFGVFEDSLPDGYGRYLTQRRHQRYPIVSARPSKSSGKWGYGSTHIRTGNQHRYFAWAPWFRSAARKGLRSVAWEERRWRRTSSF